MRYHTCKCGALEVWESGMSLEPCYACSKCGTNAFGRAPLPHDYYESKVETDEGDKPLSRCRYCYKTKREIENE